MRPAQRCGLSVFSGSKCEAFSNFLAFHLDFSLFMPHHLDLELWRITLPWDLLPFTGKGNWSRLGGRLDVSSRKGWLSPESVTAPELCAPHALQRSYPCSDWVTGRCSSHFTVDEVKIRGCFTDVCFGSSNTQLSLRFAGQNWELKWEGCDVLELLKLGGRRCWQSEFVRCLVGITQCSGFSLIPLSASEAIGFKTG